MGRSSFFDCVNNKINHLRVVGEIFRYKLELLCYDKCGSAKPQIKAQEVQIMDVNSLAHTKWECKYHMIVSY